MKTLIIADSSADMNNKIREAGSIVSVPLSIDVNGNHYVDDESIDLAALRADIRASEEAAKTAGVPPRFFIDRGQEGDRIFIVTISSKLSGTHSNALLAAEELRQEGKEVHVFDSLSAASGVTAVACKIQECLDQGMASDEIQKTVQAYIEGLQTWFVLDDLSTLTKAGRMPRMAGRLATGLSIKLICRGDQGKISVDSIKRGMKSALEGLCQKIENNLLDWSDRTIYISHVEAEERALFIKDRLKDLPVKDIQILAANGLVTVYANEGGVVLAY
ncbi:MAG: DegV family protein [Firmicutes bacterium]|nr:DegV family protein [Bacillota bacterium]